MQDRKKLKVDITNTDSVTERALLYNKPSEFCFK